MKTALCILLLIPALCFSAPGDVDLKWISPDSESIRYVGRFSEDFGSEWSGSSLSIRFTGPVLNAHLQSQQPVGVEFILNGESRFLLVKPDQTRYVLADDLNGKGMHEATLFRRSEAAYGTVHFLGAEVAENSRLEPIPEKPRKILFIGDSITCAYANETLDRDQGNTPENQNGYLSFAAIAARRLNADLHMICWSGRGLHRNRMLKFEQHETLPKIFDRTLPSQSRNKWDHERFVPDVVVINLGTNDATDRGGQKEALDKEGYIRTYQEFLRHLRNTAPEATLFLTLGPLPHAPITREWLLEAAAPFEDAHVFLYPEFSDPSEIGGHWHPSVKKHHSMADLLVKQIRAVTGWAPEAGQK